MPISWEAAEQLLDDKADAFVGDSIELSVDGGSTFVLRRGYYLPVAQNAGIEAFDEVLGNKHRFKMRKAYFPGGRFPSFANDRIRCSKTGSTIWRPSGSEPDEQGRYFVFDVQKA